MEVQTCYVCGKYFDDKVKLGLHLTPCYNEAVGVRKELWHPHPLDLVDEQRYTEYMRGKHQEREKAILDAERKGVSFVTADSFEAMRGTLGPSGQPRPRVSSARSDRVLPNAPTASLTSAADVAVPSAAASPPHQAQVAQPIRLVATGVTMLRNELSHEIDQLRQLREAEQQKASEREREFANLISGFQQALHGGRGSQPTREQHAPEASAAHVAHHLRSAGDGDARPANTAVEGPVEAPRGQPPASASEAEVLSDGRLRCGTCGKLFGKKGFQVHAQRCFRGPDDFTFSRDARFEEHHPTPNQPVPQLQDARYQAQSPPRSGEPTGTRSDQWTQFMTTYPRPVLDEKPKTAKERTQAATDAAKKAEYQRMVAQEMSGAPAPATSQAKEPTVPCGKCGRFFYESRVAKHEGTCVAKPRR